MADKKIIAICQSGGEFVADTEGLLSYTGADDAYAIDIDKKTKLSDFKSELAEMFNCRVDIISLKYFLPGNKKTLITISKDKDFSRMVNFSQDAGNVDVFVTLDETAAQNVPNLLASRPVAVAGAPVSHDGVVVYTDNGGPADMEIVNEMPLTTGNEIAIHEDSHQKARQQWENAITGVDQRFNSLSELREALHKFAIAHGFAFRYKKNDSHRIAVKCKVQGCPWRLYASRLSTTQLVCIKKMTPEHTCEGVVVKSGYRATKGWVGSIIKEKLKASPNCKPRLIAEDIKREYGIQLNYSQIWRAKEMAREQLQGSYKEAYSHIPSFCEKIKETNPGSIATFMTKEDMSFQRFFVSFHASIAGFKQGCRPLIFLDAAPLNSKYQGVLLIATSADAEDEIFPVAFGVVDEETEDNWNWFFIELKSAVSDSCRITFVADCQNGLKEALANVFDNCFHSYCLSRLAEKLNRELKTQLSHEARRFMVNDLYAAAYAPTLDGFQRSIENIKSISPEAYNWVALSGPEHWATALFQGERYNHFISTFGKPFYSWASEENELPITQMIDVFRGKLMESFYMRRLESSKWETTLTPINEEKLQKEASVGRQLQVLLAHENTFEVRGDSVDVVDLNECECSCKGWRQSGLPCSHALAVFVCISKSPYDYCSRYFKTESYCLTYAESINPIPNVDRMVLSEATDETIVVTPPPTRRIAGRMKPKKADSVDIYKRQLQCSKCKGLGHNKKTCKAS